MDKITAQAIYGSFERLGDFPLDPSSYYATLEELIQYIEDENTTAYHGQLLVVYNDVDTEDNSRNGLYILANGSDDKFRLLRVADEKEVEALQGQIDELNKKIGTVLAPDDAQVGEIAVYGEIAENGLRRLENSNMTILYDLNAQAGVSPTSVIPTLAVVKEYVGTLGQPTKIVPGNGHCTVTENMSPAQNSGQAAIVFDKLSELQNTMGGYGQYVTVKAVGKGTCYVEDSDLSTSIGVDSREAEDIAYIPALQGAQLYGSDISRDIVVERSAEYNDETGEVTAILNDNHYENIDSETILNGSNLLSNKYIIGNITVRTRPSTIKVELNENMTGKKVDSYVSSLYKRLLGLEYTELESDIIDEPEVIE